MEKQLQVWDHVPIVDTLQTPRNLSFNQILKKLAHFFFKSLYLSLFHISMQNIMSIGTQTSQKPENRNLLHLPDRSEQARDHN